MLKQDQNLSADTNGANRFHSHCNRQRRNAAGLSLIEVVVALFVLSVGILPVVSMTLDCSRTMKQAHLRTAAYTAARQELEDLRATNFDSRTTSSVGNITGTFVLPDSVQAQFPRANATGQYVIAPLSDTLQQITVQVAWYNPASSYKQVSRVRLDTLIAKEPGL